MFFGVAIAPRIFFFRRNEIEKERVNRIDGQNNGVSDLKEQTAQRTNCRDLYAALASYVARECELAQTKAMMTGNELQRSSVSSRRRN